jgi:hypothetical protein
MKYFALVRCAASNWPLPPTHTDATPNILVRNQQGCSSGTAVANLSGRPLSGPRMGGRTATRGCRRAFLGTRRSHCIGSASAGCCIFFPQNHRRRTARARPEHRGRQTNKISPGTLLPTHPCYSSPFPRNKEAEETTILLGAPHCSSDPRPFLSPCLLSLSRAGENGE